MRQFTEQEEATYQQRAANAGVALRPPVSLTPPTVAPPTRAELRHQQLVERVVEKLAVELNVKPMYLPELVKHVIRGEAHLRSVADVRAFVQGYVTRFAFMVEPPPKAPEEAPKVLTAAERLEIANKREQERVARLNDRESYEKLNQMRLRAGLDTPAFTEVQSQIRRDDAPPPPPSPEPSPEVRRYLEARQRSGLPAPNHAAMSDWSRRGR